MGHRIDILGRNSRPTPTHQEMPSVHLGSVEIVRKICEFQVLPFLSIYCSLEYLGAPTNCNLGSS